MYALTPYVLGDSLGVGIFATEEEAREAQAALNAAVQADTDGSVTVAWIDHGNVTEEEAESLVITDLFGGLF